MDNWCKICRKNHNIKYKKEIPKIQIDNKKCRCCSYIKNVSEFYKDSYRIDGYESRCKKCMRKRELELKKKKIENNPIEYRVNYWMRSLKNYTKRINLAFNLDFEFLKNILLINNINCQCCNKKMEIKYSGNKRNDSIATIDRVIPQLGYIKENVAIICWRCNRIKYDSSLDELKKVVKYIEKNVKE